MRKTATGVAILEIGLKQTSTNKKKRRKEKSADSCQLENAEFDEHCEICCFTELTPWIRGFCREAVTHSAARELGNIVRKIDGIYRFHKGSPRSLS
jgi:hypothetical protein